MNHSLVDIVPAGEITIESHKFDLYKQPKSSDQKTAFLGKEFSTPIHIAMNTFYCQTQKSVQTQVLMLIEQGPHLHQISLIKSYPLICHADVARKLGFRLIRNAINQP